MSLDRIIQFIHDNKLNKFDVMALRSGVPHKRLNEFWIWSLGDDYKTIPLSKWLERWNGKHAQDMLLQPHHSVVKSIKLMALIFLTK